MEILIDPKLMHNKFAVSVNFDPGSFGRIVNQLISFPSIICVKMSADDR